MGFESASYSIHEKLLAQDLVDGERIRIAESWFDDTTADSWRHQRAFECADCLLDDAGASWLTVGDGRWGLDSIRIKKRGFQNVLPSDIGETLLKAAKERGLIEGYAVENAEQLSFADDQFDYVFCKESLHHFPRPYRALYEMLRVAKKAVFLIEPNDGSLSATTYFSRSLAVQSLIAIARRLLGKGTVIRLPGAFSAEKDAAWEGVGNYLFKTSRYEITKIALALNLPQLVSKGLNDHYIEGCEFEPADPERSAIFRTIKSKIELHDRACKLGLAQYNLMMLGIVKVPMSAETRARFSERGWTVSDLPRNPYVSETSPPPKSP